MSCQLALEENGYPKTSKDQAAIVVLVAACSQAMVDGNPVNHCTKIPSSKTSILDASKHCAQSKDEDKPICFSYTCVH